MSSNFLYDTSDSFHELLTKTQDICAINSQNIQFIESRRGQKVITHRRYVLEPQLSSQKKRKLNGSFVESRNSSSSEQGLIFTSHNTNSLLTTGSIQEKNFKKNILQSRTLLIQT